MKPMHLISARYLLASSIVGITVLTGCAATPTVATSANARLRMARPVLLNFHHTPFNKAVAALAARADINVCFQTQALMNAGVAVNTPVTLHFTRPVSIRVALDTLLKTVGNSSAPLAWNLHKGVLLITTRSNAIRNVTFVYNVQALIAHRSGTGKAGTSPEARLRQVIENTIDRNSWIDNGGMVGSLRFFHHSMVVTTTPADQNAIRHLLRELKSEKDGF